MSKEEDIILKCTELFFRFGVRNITMDDIAKELGISKKTLYLHFQNKASLVEKIMEVHINFEKNTCVCIAENNDNAIVVMQRIYEMNFSKIAKVNPVLIYELKRYYPKTWKLFENHKNAFIYKTVYDNLMQGIAEGLYRPNLNPVIIAKIYTGRLDLIADGTLFPASEFNIKEILIELFEYSIRGIATEKGLKVLQTINLKVL